MSLQDKTIQQVRCVSPVLQIKMLTFQEDWGYLSKDMWLVSKNIWGLCSSDLNTHAISTVPHGILTKRSRQTEICSPSDHHVLGATSPDSFSLLDLLHVCLISSSLNFPGGSDSKESPCNAGHPSSIPGSGRSPGEGNGYAHQHSCLENSMDRGAGWATVQGVAKIQIQLSN